MIKQILISIVVILALVAMMLWVDKVWADDAVKAIIGEASNQGYHGMLAVAVGIRNRGSLKGVYGVNSPHIDNEPRYVWEMARKAWNESETNRIHTGDHWASKIVDKEWLDHMRASDKFVEVYDYKDHVFFREVK